MRITKNTVNVIITKRYKTQGGALTVPDFNHTFEQSDSNYDDKKH